MSKKTRFAFAGLRHPHGWAIWNRVQKEPDCSIVAVCEEDRQTRQELLERPDISHVYDSYERMLDEIDADVMATADFYGNRGRILIGALEKGMHALADKPICTRIDELDRIAELVEEKSRVLGCELDLRALPQLAQARELIHGGDIGEVHAISFGGQHPYFCYQRADWYLDESTYGGVLNDITIHGVDALEWMTGLRFTEVVAARAWSALKHEGFPFRDAAQVMLTMDNGCGVMGDVSFISPASCGFALPYYWELTFWGSKGVLRTGLNRDSLELSIEGQKETVPVPKQQERPPDYFHSFMRELAGQPGDLDTGTIIDASRKALRIQQAADEGLHNLPL